MKIADKDSLRLYVDASQKQQFKKACRAHGETMSKALRRFMRDYIRDAGLHGCRFWLVPILFSIRHSVLGSSKPIS
jgi:hypothetical protein